MNYKLVKLNSGRNALRYIIRAFRIKELYVPYYICSALRNVANKENCKMKYYHLDKTFYPVCSFPENAFILYPNYFGICTDIVNELSSKYKNLIVDNAHSYYSEPKGIASFNSLRKFFPFLKDGSLLYISTTFDFALNVDDFRYSIEKYSYKMLCKNEQRINNQTLKLMSECTSSYYNAIDFNYDKKERNKKYLFWSERLDESNCLKISYNAEFYPFAYPYLSSSEESANELVISLKKQGYDIFRYWNNLPNSFQERIFYTNLVVIPLFLP